MKSIFLILTIFSVEYLSANIADKAISVKESQPNKEILRDKNLNITIFTREVRYSRPPREVRMSRKSRSPRKNRSITEIQDARIVSFRRQSHQIKKIHLSKDISSYLDNNLFTKDKS